MAIEARCSSLRAVRKFWSKTDAPLWSRLSTKTGQNKSNKMMAKGYQPPLPSGSPGIRDVHAKNVFPCTATRPWSSSLTSCWLIASKNFFFTSYHLSAAEYGLANSQPTSSFSPSRTAIWLNVLYLFQISSLLSHVWNLTLASPSGRLNSGSAEVRLKGLLAS